MPRLHGRDRRRARAGRKLHPHALAGHEGQDPDRPRQDRAPDGGRTAFHRSAGSRACARSRFRTVEDRDANGAQAGPLSAPQFARAGPQPPGDGGQSRRLHPVQSLRPRLPRSAGQRRDRHGRPRPRRKDRVRLRRSDGRFDLRRLRRMRAGLPDRRADAGDAGRRRQRLHRQGRPHGRQRLPLLRRRLPAHLSHQGRQAALRHRQERPGQREPALRQGPLRLRLRAQSATAVEADDPQGRRAESAARIYRPVKSVDAFPRSDLGRGARPCRGRLEENPRPRRTAGARRFRLGQGLERRGLSVPETRSHRLRHQQCRSLHAAVPCLLGRRPDGRRRLGRGVGHVQRMQEFGSDPRDRRQSDRESSGRGDVFQASRQARRHADRGRSARPGAQAPRHPHAAIQERHRRRFAQRHPQHDRLRKTLRRAVHPDLRRGLQGVCREHQGLHAGRDGADLRHRGRRDAHRGAQIRPRQIGDHLLGHGHLAAHPRHRQCALPDRAVADHRPDRPAGHRAASAARPEQRAGRFRRRPDPDVLPRLQVGRGPANPRPLRGRLGH